MNCTIALQIRKYLASVGMPPEKGMMATPHFSWAELLVNQKDLPSLEVLNNLLSVARVLEVYREKVFNNSTITITSGWRSPTYNKKIGGASNSYHCKGMAIDFIVANYTPQNVQDKLDIIHFGGLEFASTWTHIDIRDSICRFNENNTIRQSHYNMYQHTQIFHN